MTYLLIGMGAWLLALTGLLYRYRAAIIRLQRDIWERGGVVDEVTTPKP